MDVPLDRESRYPNGKGNHSSFGAGFMERVCMLAKIR
jgi:hypothetical protein